MDEVVRDLVVIGLIALVCFAGAVEYVYWRFGVDKIVASLQRIEHHSRWTQVHMDQMRTMLAGRKVA